MIPDLSIRSFSNDQFYLDKFIYSNYYKIKGIPEGSTVLDLGSGAGYFSYFAHLRGASTVHSFEPFFENYESLLRNTMFFRDSIRTHNLGIASQAGFLSCNFPQPENNFADFFKIKFSAEPKTESSFSSFFVTIDSAIEQVAGRISLLKISTNGNETTLLHESNKLSVVDNICGDTSDSDEDVTAMRDRLVFLGFTKNSILKNPKDNTLLFLFSREGQDIFEI